MFSLNQPPKPKY